MRNKLALVTMLAALLLSLVVVTSAQLSPQNRFQQAVDLLETKGDVRAAMKLFEETAKSVDRSVAARSLFYLGACREKLGAAEAGEARIAYERVVREFGDQSEVVAQARVRLAALADPSGGKSTTLSVRQVWAGPDVETTGSPSADGRLLAFTDYQTGDVAIRDLATGEVRRVTKTGDIMKSGEQSLFATFSPDNKQIAFAWLDTRNNVFDTRIIAADGTGLRTLYHDNAGWVMPLAWTADGRHVVVSLDLIPAEGTRLRQIGLVSVADGSLDVLRSGPFPAKISSSPDSRYLVYDVAHEGGRSDIFLLSIREKRETRLVSHPANDWAPVWTPDGRGVVFASNRTGSPALWMVEVAEGKAVAPPELVRSDIGAGYGAMGFTRNGALFYGIHTGMVDVYTAPVNLNECRVLAPPAPVSQQGVGANRAPAWSPDGKSLAYLSTRNQGLVTAIMIRALETGKEREIPVNADRIKRLAWFPDGAALAFIGWDSTGTSIFRLDVESGALSTLVPAGPEPFFIQVHVVPDGRALVYSVLNLKTRGQAIVTRNLQTGEEKVVTSSLYPLGLAPSPDGKQLAVFDNDEKTRRQAILLMPLAGGESREVRRFEKPGLIAGRPSWSPDGRFILFPAKAEDKAEIMCISVDGGEPRKLGISRAGLGDVSVHPDGTRVAFGAGESKSEVWALENFLPKAKVVKAGTRVERTRPGATSSARGQTTGSVTVPMAFEANVGQTDPQVKFVSRGPAYTLFLTSRDAVLAHGTDVIRLTFRGASAQPGIVPVDRLAGGMNYLIGNDPNAWRKDVATYARVRYEELYPGIDLVFYGNDRQLEYDLIVKPGADTRKIRVDLTGTRGLKTADNGDLVASTGKGEIRLRRPVIYQTSADGQQARVAVDGRYRLTGAHTVAFDIGRYDRTRPLVIDPVVVYATYLSGNGTDAVQSGSQFIAVDASGAAYVGGYTDSSDFPTTGSALQPEHIVKFSHDPENRLPCFPEVAPKYVGGYAFVAKLSPDGSSLVYGTYLGGTSQIQVVSGIERCGGPTNIGNGIAIDTSGNAYITGYTNADDFPLTSPLENGGYTMFVTKLDPSGSNLVYSRRLKSSVNVTMSTAITVGTDGSAYLTGRTRDTDFPATLGAFQTTCQGCYNGFLTQGFDAFVLKLGPSGLLSYATYLGGAGDNSGAAIAVDAAGQASVTGFTSAQNFPTTPGAVRTTAGADAGVLGGADVFVTKLSADGSSLIFSTYLNGDRQDLPGGVAIDAAGNTYVTGGTRSPEFPTTPGAFMEAFPASPAVSPIHTFVTKLSPAGSLVYSTFLAGAAGQEQGVSVGIDGGGRAYVVGSIDSPDFPITFDAFQPGFGSTFLSVFDASGSALAFSTFLGGNSGASAQSVVVGADGSAYIVGNVPDRVDTNNVVCCRYPTTAGAFQQDVSPTQAHGGPNDVFVTRIAVGAPTDTMPPTVQCGVPDGLWHASNVSVACTAGDTGSGLANTADAAFSLWTSVAALTEASNASTGSRQVCDVAGNCAVAGPSSGHMVDKKPPTAAITSPTAGSFIVGEIVSANYTCGDGGSGVATCAGPVANGAAVPTNVPGPQTFSVTSTDGVGHATTVSVDFAVRYATCALFDQAKTWKSGSTIPIKLQLCDAAGLNLLSPGTVITATGIRQVSTSSDFGVNGSGDSNPDLNFRYEGGKYAFNLKTTSLTSGVYLLDFQVGGEAYSVEFRVGK